MFSISAAEDWDAAESPPKLNKASPEERIGSACFSDSADVSKLLEHGGL
jgi:hypothetical protein